MKVSIIVPVYNHELYIDRCIDSIRSQSYKNLEIVIVNDGSTDKTLERIKKHSQEDNRIIVCNQPNLGTHLSRLNGIKISSGQVLMNLDSDDFLEYNAVELMVEDMQKTNADIVICDYYQIKNNRKYIVRNQISQKADEVSILRNLLVGKLTVHLWGRLYKRFLLEHIELPISRAYTEDVLTNFKILSSKKVSLSLVNSPLVNYVVHDSNISYSNDKEPVEGFFKEFKWVEEILKENNFDIILKPEIALYKCKIWIVYCRKNGQESKNEEFHRRYFRENYGLAKNLLPWYLRIEMLSYSFSLKLGKVITASMKKSINLLRYFVNFKSRITQ